MESRTITLATAGITRNETSIAFKNKKTLLACGRFSDETEYDFVCGGGTATMRFRNAEIDETIEVPAKDALGIWSLDAATGSYQIFVETDDRNPMNAFDQRDDGRLVLKRPDMLSPDDWNRIAGAFNMLGYATNTAETARRAFSRRAESASGYLLQPDQQTAIERLFAGKDAHDAEWRQQADKLERKAIAFYGTTSVHEFAGYITRNGSMLNFSHEGRQRDMDHRDVNELFEDEELHDKPGSNVAGLIRFMMLGNIRVGDSSIDLCVAPTEAQKRTLAAKIRHAIGDIYIDLSAPDGATVAGRKFPAGTSPSTIIAYIDRYFETGFANEGDKEYAE